MDHMRISGKEPSSVILGQKSSLTVENSGAKVQIQAKAKRDGVITHKITIKMNFNTENFDALKTLRINRSRP